MTHTRTRTPPTGPAVPLIAYDDGVHLLGTVLWFDAPRERDLCFLSHSRLPRFPAHRKVLCTQATSQLARKVLGTSHTLVSPYGREFSLGTLAIELFPSGFMLGAAQLLVRHRGSTIVYAGDVGMAGTRTAERIQVRPCDVLVMSAVYGDPAIELPPRAETEAEAVDWARATLSAGRTPVFLANRAGKAQDLLKLLSSHGIKVRAHRRIQEYTRIYRELGVGFTDVKGFRGTPARDEAVVWPISLRNSPAIGRMRRAIRVAVCTGRAAFEAPRLRSRYRAQAAFPLSGHSDARSLLEFVKATGAQRVYLTRGRVAAFAALLQENGVAAIPLLPPTQLSLV